MQWLKDGAALVFRLSRGCEVESRQFCGGPQTRIVVLADEDSLQRGESRFAGTVTGGNPFNFPPVTKRNGHAFNLSLRRGDQMKSAEDQPKARINC